MSNRAFWFAVLAGGAVLNVLDVVLHGIVLHTYYGGMPDLFNPPGSPALFVVSGFVYAFVFAWVYDRVYGSFSGGPKGGAVFGFYAGIMKSFPTWLLMHLIVKDFTYGLSWIWTINGIVWTVILGTVVGAVYKKPVPRT